MAGASPARTSCTAPVGTHDDCRSRSRVTCLVPVRLVRTSSSRPRATTKAAAQGPWSCRSVSWPGSQLSSQTSTDSSACSRVHQRSPSVPNRTSELHRCSALANARTSRSSWCSDRACAVPRPGEGGAMVMAAPYTSKRCKLGDQLQYMHRAGAGRRRTTRPPEEIGVLRREHVPGGVVEALPREPPRLHRGDDACDQGAVRRQCRTRLERHLVGGGEG